MQRITTNVPKKKYQTPSLTIHGTVQKLTQAVGVHGNKDGGTVFRVDTAI